jgi:hypothetical protein
MRCAALKILAPQEEETVKNLRKGASPRRPVGERRTSNRAGVKIAAMAMRRPIVASRIACLEPTQRRSAVPA